MGWLLRIPSLIVCDRKTRMHRITEPKLIVGFVLIFGVLCVNALVLASNMQTVTRNRQNVEHSHEVTAAIESVFSTVQDAETGQRGFLLTDEKEYLKPYISARKSIDQRLSQLVFLARGDRLQRSRVAELERVVAVKLSDINATIQLEQAGRGSEALTLVLSDQGRKNMDAIRAEVARMESEQHLQLERLQRRELRK